MTEAEWLSCADPQAMLNFLRGRVTDRKLRLFACDCARQLWQQVAGERVHGPPDARSTTAVELAEAFIDGQASVEDLRMAAGPAGAASQDAFWSVGYPVGPHAFPVIAAAAYAEAAVAEAVADELTDDRLYCAIDGLERTGPEVATLRCLFNPYWPLAFDPRWRTADVIALARGLYEERAFDRMPVLADALMDAGCDAAAILAHCRGSGPHVRGCWAVDLVLAQE